ncbi:MAG: cytochrome P450 [Chloroflexi bacterium]|nr:cytochrome P450 [Chloroflexota bacterium]
MPDRGVMDLLTASARSIAQARMTRDGLTEFQVGAAIYRGSWMLDGLFLMEAAQFLGLEGQAAEALEAVLRRAADDGTLAIIPTHLKETAVGMAAIIRQHELFDGKALPTGESEVVRRALRRIDQLRLQGGEHGMPPAFGDGGLDGERYELTTLLWTLAALSIVRRSDVVPDDLRAAASMLAENLHVTFRNRAERDMQPLVSGGAYLPMFDPRSVLHHRMPDFVGEPDPWQRVNPGTATYALAHAIYPGEVFDPDDPVVTNLCRLLEEIDDEEGIPGDTGWLPYRAVWTYAASFYAHVWLYAGRPDKAIDYLYAFANHAAPTGVWREEQSITSSGNRLRYGDMPHNWASAEFVRLVRNLLVFERGNELELLAGIRPSWLHADAEIVVERTPTRYGRLSLHVSVNSQNEVNIDLDADWAKPPERIVVRLPEAVTTASVDGHPVQLLEEGLLLPRAGHVRATLVLARAQAAVRGHAAVKAAVRDWPAFSSAYPFKPDIRAYRQYPLESDGAAHDDYRAILAPWFHRRRVDELEPRIRTIATALVRDLAAAGRAEAVNDLALPMVVRSLGVTLGRPQDVDEWLSWGVEINIVDGRRDGRGTDAYLSRVFEEVGLKPGEDVFSHIAASSFQGRPLTQRERFGLGSMVLAAGRAAVVNLLSGAIWWLASHPRERARLADDPTLVSTAIEELLRYLSPAPELERMVTGDTDWFPTGDQVAISFVSANHDPSVFPDPETVDLGRRPNHHLAFGNGPHTCLGAHLGKLEARVFVEELLRTVPRFRYDGDAQITWQQVTETRLPKDFISLPIGVGE